MTELVNLSETTVLKDGNAFCVALRDGRLPVDGDHPLGLYRDDVRHLRGLELRLAGRLPRLLVGSDAAGSGAVFELTNPELTLAAGDILPLQSLRLRIARRITQRAMADRITLRSHARKPIGLDVELRIDADFVPMLEVRGLDSPRRREVRCRASGDTVTLSAIGLDDRERSTTVTCHGATAHDDGRLVVPVSLRPGEQRTLDVTITATQPGDPAPGEAPDGRVSTAEAGAEADAWLAERPRVEVDDELVGRVLRRSLLDLRLLASQLDSQRYYAAGVPWYATLFGRDSIITALEMLAFDPGMAEETLRLLAGRLGTRVDDAHDEEPGKVLHELRPGELAELELTPLARYYGTIDATPLLLCLLCEHADWTGSLALFQELRPQVEQALAWIDDYGDLDGDGALEYRRRAPGGLVNQGW
jgi:glycogen debranching enzyme